MATLPSNAISSNNFNTNYMASISGSDETGSRVDIRASLPENFSLSISAEWEPLLNPANLPNGAGGAGQLGRAFNLLSNTQFMNQALTQMIWLSTTPVEFNMPFLFDAISDAQKEVLDPVKKLMKLILPTQDGVTLKVPGPGIGGVIDTLGQTLGGEGSVLERLGSAINSLGGGSNTILTLPQVSAEDSSRRYSLALQIGRNLKFDDIIVKSVNPQFESMFTRDGHPIAVQVDVTFTTSKMLVKGDIDRIFGGTTPGTPEAAQEENRRVEPTPAG